MVRVLYSSKGYFRLTSVSNDDDNDDDDGKKATLTSTEYKHDDKNDTSESLHCWGDYYLGHKDQAMVLEKQTTKRGNNNNKNRRRHRPQHADFTRQ